MQIARNSIPLRVPALALTLGAGAGVAHANRLEDAQLSATCTGHKVDITAIMIPNTPGKVEYQLSATPVGAGIAQGATGSLDLPLNTLPYGAAVSASRSGAWPSPLVGTFDITGTVSLVGATEVYLTTFLNQPIRITCVAPPPPPGGEGCTPDYWKKGVQRTWVGYNPGDSFATVFDVPARFCTSLLGALKSSAGSGEGALAREAVAALLNAANSKIKFGLTESEVIEMVQDAYRSGDFDGVRELLAVENALGCPLPEAGPKPPCNGSGGGGSGRGGGGGHSSWRSLFQHWARYFHR